MKKEDFCIVLEFYVARYDKDEKAFHPTKWCCTDVGTRVIVAIALDQQDPRNYNGPPYSVAERVFDEYDMEGCAMNPEEL